MLLNEIITLNEWLIKKEDHFQPIQKLNKLQSILNSNIQARHPNQRTQSVITPFTEEKNEAIEALKNYRLSELSNDQISCLSIHNADNFMGEIAADKLSEIFRNEMHDVAYLAKEVTSAHQALSTAKLKIAETCKYISPYFEAINEVEYLDNKARLSIIFKDGVKIETLNDLEARSKEWSNIMYGIGRALDIPSNEFKVLGARNGSLVIDLFMYAPAIIPLGYILNRSLAIIERFALSLRRIEAIYDLELDDPAFQELNEQIQATNKEYFSLKKVVSAKKIADKILDENECPKDKRAESQVFLEKSIKQILNHLRKGGDLDAFIPKDDKQEENEENSQQKEAIELIESFRHKKLKFSTTDFVKLLEHFDFEDEEEN